MIKRLPVQDHLPSPLLRIGIIGGGQLGKMITQVAKQMGFYVTILDASPQCPTASLADAQIVGSLYDADKLKALAAVSDVLTYEIEHIDVETLHILQQQGHMIYPSPHVLAVIQDKFKQKKLLADKQLPVPRFEWIESLTPEHGEQLTFPVVQKACYGGYDGRGVVVLKNRHDLEKALKVPSIIEEYVEFYKELAVIIARSPTGETVCYPVVEMVFDDTANICDQIVAPARIEPILAQQAQAIALKAVEALEGVGVFGVELFLTADKRILINEIAPRPHNSGHYTIEACLTCQFEQLVRIVSGLPLGTSTLLKPAVMLNLLGQIDYEGTPIINGLSQALTLPGTRFHWYGKQITQPFRKMGHMTILNENVHDAIEIANKIKGLLTITAKEKK